MEHVGNEGDMLRQYGIHYLTGEAEGIWGLGRILTDLTPEGADLVGKFLSIAIPRGTSVNERDPQGAAIMMPREMMRPLLVYALLSDHDIVVTFKATGCYESMTAMSNEEWQENESRFRELGEGTLRFFQKQGSAHGGTAQRHAMFGFAHG